MARWEWLDQESSSKELGEFFEAPNPTTGAYGRVVLYDTKKPQPVVQLSSEALTYSEVEVEYAKHKTRSTAYTFTLIVPQGGSAPTLTGVVIGFSRERMKGIGADSQSLYKVTLSIRRTD